MSDAARVLHVNDCAFTAERMLVEAHRRGLPWHYMPLAAEVGRSWSGPVGQAQKALLGASWLARLGARSLRHDLLHVHSGSVLRHSRLVPKRYVLHLHGTDIRTLQYDPAWTAVIRKGVAAAEAVLYSTPDLAEHTLPLRPDATYLPVPIDVDRLPAWSPSGTRPQVFFASRWEAVKGVETQLETAERIVAAVGDTADVVGLQWGPEAAAAEKVGVRLRPKVDHATYLALLASSTAVVGQSAGILSASELEAMGTGAPLVLPVGLPLYAESAPPVLGGTPAAAAEAVAALVAGTGAHDPEKGRRWVREQHGVDRAVDTVLGVYATVLG